MADSDAGTETIEGVEQLKKTRIKVFVDEALSDMLVVNYEFGVKIFRGVLLDSTKKNLPCGVAALNPAFTAQQTTATEEDDPLYSTSQRFQYMHPEQGPKRVQIPTKYNHPNKRSKMTVRLRPRQVLCSKCKEICNENSENVSRKRRSIADSEAMISATITTPSLMNTDNSPVPMKRFHLTQKVVASTEMEVGGAQLVPRLKRLTDEELRLSQNRGEAIDKENNNFYKTESLDCEDEKIDQNSITKRSLRKKKPIKNVWVKNNITTNKDESNEMTKDTANNSHTPKTIKISYGPQGQGTVLKIPTKTTLSSDNASTTSTTTCSNNNSSSCCAENVSLNDMRGNGECCLMEGGDRENLRATRRALRRAKKEARRKVLVTCIAATIPPAPAPSSGQSSTVYPSSSSPRYTVGSASPRNGLGTNNSPRYTMYSSSLTTTASGTALADQVVEPKKRKHKMKHKKRHKDNEKRHKDDAEVSSTQNGGLSPKGGPAQQIAQKLSINLRRLNNAIYTTTTRTTLIEEENTSSGSSDEHCSEQVPDFPASHPPLLLRINAQSLRSACTSDGGVMLVGDVVWGKIQGFPWWPGKVLTITSCGGKAPQAHVSWYGSTTSSLIQCDQLSPYLENFKSRYNKKKRGAYKEAIKQATHEAKENAELRQRQPLGTSPSHNILSQQLVPTPLTSPIEIDVAS